MLGGRPAGSWLLEVNDRRITTGAIVDDRTAALIGLAVYFGMKLVDRILPDGYHLTTLERWLRRNDDKEIEK